MAPVTQAKSPGWVDAPFQDRWRFLRGLVARADRHAAPAITPPTRTHRRSAGGHGLRCRALCAVPARRSCAGLTRSTTSLLRAKRWRRRRPVSAQNATATWVAALRRLEQTSLRGCRREAASTARLRRLQSDFATYILRLCGAREALGRVAPIRHGGLHFT